MLAALASARFVHYAACTLLFGLSLYRLYAPSPRRARAWLMAAAALALASGLGWLCLVTVNLAGALDFEALRTLVTELSFGRVWVVRLVLIAVALTLTNRPGLMVAAAAVLLGSIGLTGHTQIHEDGLRWLHEGSDVVHLLGAGAWLGGLMGLTLMLRREPGPDLALVIGRFSRMGYLAVGALVVSGLINAWMLIGRPAALLTSGYGRLLLVKLALFAVMLAFAMINRFGVSPRLTSTDPPIATLRRHVIAEQALGLAVLACVACLGLGEPPG